MSAELEQFESQLQAHFQALADAKRPTGQPLFALEHCLEKDQLQQMRAHLYASIRRHGMSSKFKYCWLVHAAEHGYTFDGLEYWQSFAALTPDWTYFGDRDRLRRWFAEFATRLNGVRPIGTWAQHYRLIAWPITHALLPSDLQVQLAQTLYQVRYRLDELMLLDHASVGRMLARYVEWPSTRFGHFLEQRELVGRVVRALLEGTPEEPVIYLRTLQRITDDLNAKSQARAWLRDARKHFDRFRAKLASSNPRFALSPPPGASEEQKIRTEMDEQGVLLRPRLQLRRTASDRWEAQLLVPSFQPLVDLKPRFREHLARVRYSIPAHGNALFLGQSLLAGRPVPKRLAAWPQERQPLLAFNSADAIFDRIVNAECQLLPAKLWVFLSLADGSARHIQGQHVRAGETYLVVARDASQLEGLGKSVALECAGVSAVHLEMPEVVGPELAAALKRSDIALHSRVFVDPVGLRPRQWSEGGSGEWLSTETPLLALSCEYDIQAYQIALNEGASFGVERAPGTAPTLVSFQNLPVGRHEVSISALTVQSSAFGVQRRSVASAVIELYVRHPITWIPNSQLPAAMVVDVNPAVPGLDDLLEERLLLRAEGDEARHASCYLVLTNSATGEESASRILTHRLPLSAEIWRNDLHQFLRQRDELQLLTASQASISVQAEDLGEVRIPLRLEVEPLRWALRKNRTSATLFLVDEGVSDPIVVTYYEFEHPLRGRSLEPQSAAEGIACNNAAGLYVARAGSLCEGIAVASQERAHGFAALGAHVSRTELSGEATIETLLDHIKLWTNARASSNLARFKLRSVCEALMSQLLTRICGAQWVGLERALDRNDSGHTWAQLEGGVTRHPSFAISLAAEWSKNRLDGEFDLQMCFGRLAILYKVSSDRQLIDLAWAIASNSVGADAQSVTQAMADWNFAVLVRGARLLLLCRDKRRGEQ